MMTKGAVALTVGCLFGAAHALVAQEPPKAAAKESNVETAAASSPATPKAEQSVTEHTIKIGGAVLRYKATAGTLLIRNDADEPIAAIGYTAYTKDGVEASSRPITFGYNGGPGSSSIWLHMGALGPRRIVTTDAAPTPPPPYRVVDNGESILDLTDLVMIDPVGTGLSHAVGKAKGQDFWGVDQDADSVARFVVQYVNDNGRWNSPKYLFGESYGTMRSAVLVDVLQSKWNMAFNGVVLVSVFVDARTDMTMPGNDLGYEMYLPTYAAIAWYHHVLQDPPPLDALLAKAREFAAGPYATALAKGDALPDTERKEVVASMSRLTGLSPSYLDKANLRVSEGEFTAELLREHSEIVGRLDARFTGVALDRLAEETPVEEDPQSAAISGAFTAAFLDYLHGELKFGEGKTYKIESDLWLKWDWKHKSIGAHFPSVGWPDAAVDLAHAIAFNPALKVLVLNGYFDLATPFFGTEYTMDHLGLEKKLRGNIEMKYFEAGHMMYLHPASLVAFKAAVADFIQSTDRL
jgi:carboxypeptidase C (cathepsin A)